MSSPGVLDPRIVLATSLHAQPGVYALLIGSGVSTAAGIPTGWKVVKELTRRAAAANGDTTTDAFDAEAWWSEHGDDQPLGYSSLLERLAPNPGARRALLAKFFEPTDDEREQGLKMPTRAHHAIAELVRRGTVRVILTTNFDQLIERALTEAGVSFQRVDSPSAIGGMEPLTHARCTVVKLHGDYARLDQLNTLEELSTYDPDLSDLLDRILDEYGLVTCGWSAEWDVALVDAIKAVRSRRYPLFWTAHGVPGPAASELIARHRAQLVANVSAEGFFPELLDRLDALDSLQGPSLSRAMAVTRLKRWLANPIEHIRVHDLLMDQVDEIAALLRDRPKVPPSTEPADLEAAHDELRAATDTLLHLVAQGVFFDRDRLHTDLWVTVLDRLLKARKLAVGHVHDEWVALEHYPALLVMYAGVAAAVAAGREDVAVRLLVEPVFPPYRNDSSKVGFDALNSGRVLSGEWINAFPSWGDMRWLFAPSHLLRASLTSVLEPLVGEGDPTDQLLDRTEFRVALSQHLAVSGELSWSAPGEFLVHGWAHPATPVLISEFVGHEASEAWTAHFGKLEPTLQDLVRYSHTFRIH